MTTLQLLVGSGDRIARGTAAFAVLAIGANLVWPHVFTLHLGLAGSALGWFLVGVGVPLWLASAALVAMEVPKGRLITSGPFALVLHPLYTSLSLLVIPGVGLLLDSWAGLAIGGTMYLLSRRFRTRENEQLDELFGEEYREYRGRVLAPWL